MHHNDQSSQACGRQTTCSRQGSFLETSCAHDEQEWWGQEQEIEEALGMVMDWCGQVFAERGHQELGLAQGLSFS